MNYYIAVLKKYAVFSGRATRAEYWYFVLFNFLAAIILSVISWVIWGSDSATSGSVLTYIYSLAVVIPGIAVTIRRLHDINKSGAWWLIGLIPFIGSIWLLVLTVTPGTPGDNTYGPNPSQQRPTPPAAV